MAEAGFYAVEAIGSLMGAPGISGGVTGARHVNLRGVLKGNDPSAPYTVANEYIASQLGAAVGLPVPPGTIVRLDNGEYAYAMLQFGLAGEKPPPADASRLVLDRQPIAALIAVFDCWILNGDRHSRNFAYIPGAAVSVFDHGHALFGTNLNQGQAYVEAHATRAFWHGGIISELTSSIALARAVSRINCCPDEHIREASNVPHRLGLLTREEAKAVAQVLINRRSALYNFIDTSHSSFPKIQDWGLST